MKRSRDDILASKNEQVFKVEDRYFVSNTLWKELFPEHVVMTMLRGGDFDEEWPSFVFFPSLTGKPMWGMDITIEEAISRIKPYLEGADVPR